MPPEKPLLVYDGDCGFCKLWIRRGRQITQDAVAYLPSQDPEIARWFPEVSAEKFNAAVQFFDTDGTVYSGAEAVFRTLAQNPRYSLPLRAFQSIPGFALVTNHVYNFVAAHRPFFSLLTRILWGHHVEQPEYYITRSIFLRVLGAIYLVAFVSLWLQIIGLVGHDGLLPADRYLAAIKQACQIQGIGIDRYRLVPTLCWFSPSDGFLNFQCAAGTIISLVLIAGFAPAPCLAMLWLLYLSLATIGQDFLGFQWDNLLLETGFLAIFFAPLQWLPGTKRTAPPSQLVLWLLRFLLFKLVFSSGCVKLASQDPHWRDLTALKYHWHTQPLPTWFAWYFDQMPMAWQKFSCAAMFAIELVAPLLIFGPRRLRLISALAIGLLQFLILLTGNYTFFNFLTMALCLLLLADKYFLARAIQNPAAKIPWPAILQTRKLAWPKVITVPLAVVFVSISSLQIVSIFGVNSILLTPIAVVDSEIAPLRTISNYGLFAVMTTTRYEIIIEGSEDGVIWHPYEFKFKPGNLKRRPGFVEPLQPRLDWQMWFAALSTIRQNGWLANLCERLLQGSPSVLALLQKNPFTAHPPRYVRAELYEYKFASPAERQAGGAWWRREHVGEYLSPMTLSQ